MAHMDHILTKYSLKNSRVDETLTLSSRNTNGGSIALYTVYTPPMESQDFAKNTALKVRIRKSLFSFFPSTQVREKGFVDTNPQEIFFYSDSSRCKYNNICLWSG